MKKMNQIHKTAFQKYKITLKQFNIPQSSFESYTNVSSNRNSPSSTLGASEIKKKMNLMKMKMKHVDKNVSKYKYI